MKIEIDPLLIYYISVFEIAFARVKTNYDVYLSKNSLMLTMKEFAEKDNKDYHPSFFNDVVYYLVSIERLNVKAIDSDMDMYHLIPNKN